MVGWLGEQIHLMETNNLKGVAVNKYYIASPLNYPVTLIEIADPTKDERIGWATAIPREGWIDVEELFVRPSYRNNGYGRTLSIELQKFSIKRKLPLRLWIPHSDIEGDRRILKKVVENLGLTLKPSGVRWASFKAEPYVSTGTDTDLTVQPPPSAVKPSFRWLYASNDQLRRTERKDKK